jgi:N-acetyl-gamma-glutamyl-phosphate reductase
MLVKVTAELAAGADASRVQATLDKTYKHEPFVKVLSGGELPKVSDSNRTGMCVLGSTVSSRTVQVVSSLDNLRKGAASQAIQGFNLAYGLREETGLSSAGSEVIQSE